jgi:hypothetical protein
MSTHHIPVKGRRGFAVWPTTRLGRWAVVLTVVGVAEFAIALAIGAFAALGAGLAIAGAAAALVAIFRHAERAISVYLIFIPILLYLLHPLFISD